MKSNILVVEDEDGIRETINIFLKNQGYETVIAKNGQEGLKLLEENTIHLAIVDIMMPVMDGITMVMKLGKNMIYQLFFLVQNRKISIRLLD